MKEYPPFQTERIFKGPGFAETLYLGICDGERVIRKISNPDALDFSRTALVREINMLRSLPAVLSDKYIRLIRTNLADSASDSLAHHGDIWYDMPYLSPEEGWKTLSSCLTDGSLSKKEAKDAITDCVSTAFLTFAVDCREPKNGYAEVTMLSAMRESLARALRSPELESLLKQEFLVINGVKYRSMPEIMNSILENTPCVMKSLTPYKDRLIHGDYFPENIMYNTKWCDVILLDPVSVRAVHRGDFMLDIDKMDEWLSGELPALRSGAFICSVSGSTIDFELHSKLGKLAGLAELGISGFYRELLLSPEYSRVFEEEKGWERRREFIRAFYALSIIPLVGPGQAVARFVVAVRALNRFMEMSAL